MTTRERDFCAGLVTGSLVSSLLAAVFGQGEWWGPAFWCAVVLPVFLALRWWMEPRP